MPDGTLRVGEYANPHFAAAFDVAADRTPSGFNLARGQLPGAGGLEAKFTEADGIRAPGQAVIAAFVHFAVFGTFGLQHD